MSMPACVARSKARRASVGMRCGSHSRLTCTVRPMCCSWMAASSPSPPLLPGPATIQIRRACGAVASASRAAARPARSIKGVADWLCRRDSSARMPLRRQTGCALVLGSRRAVMFRLSGRRARPLPARPVAARCGRAWRRARTSGPQAFRPARGRAGRSRSRPES